MGKECLNNPSFPIYFFGKRGNNLQFFRKTYKFATYFHNIHFLLII